VVQAVAVAVQPHGPVCVPDRVVVVVRQQVTVLPRERGTESDQVKRAAQATPVSVEVAAVQVMRMSGRGLVMAVWVILLPEARLPVQRLTGRDKSKILRTY
jgi:hypothetical protein